MPLDEIRNKIEETRSNFVDIEFPPVQASIHTPNEGQPFKNTIVWKRPKEFMIIDESKGVIKQNPNY